ncbi:MAG: DNA repair protein RecN [Bacteroidales bacterium]|nr:DNA repair protein RecN [Bacteroidales bacterium]
MLKTLHIENYALIRQSDIDFAGGFVAITGETGAGKSILLGALGLLLGGRADVAVLADREHKCVVEARFDVEGLGLEPMFAEADVDYDPMLIVRREVLPSAKSRSFVNDTPVPLAFLRQLGERLVDIHSQHQTLTLLGSTFRLRLLDTVAASGKGGSADLDAYRSAFAVYTQLKRELEELTAEELRVRKEADYLQFQFDELSAARLQAGEQAALEQEANMLAHAGTIREGLAEAEGLMDDDSGSSSLSKLRQARSALQRVEAYQAGLSELANRLEVALIELDDIYAEVQSASEAVAYNPERLQEVDDRLSLLYRLEKKHAVESVEELIAIRDDIDGRLQSVATLDDRIHDLMEQVDKAFTAMQQAAVQLTASRRQAAQLLVANLTPLLADLGMAEAKFAVDIAEAETYGPHGHDEVSFLFNANRGGQMRDLSRVASGGELSRLMLAIKSVLTSRTLLPTIIFDEIDTGVSGDISVAVGGIMRRMAERMQVVAITHLPQIAAKAGQHLKVYKQIEGEQTVSRIRQLEAAERVQEVAVMLSSDPPTPAALQTAKELMQ